MLKGLLEAIGVYRFYEWWLESQVNGSKELPRHIGLIIDGNRRWAGGHDILPWMGHWAGADKVEKLLDWCLELGIRTVTLYVFSTENFERPRQEVDEIMKVCEQKLRKTLQDERIHRNRVRVKALGRIDLLPESLRELIRRVEEKTAGYDNYWLNIAIAYGGRKEIVDATRKIGERILMGELKPSDIDESLLEKHLYTSHLPNPEPDLIIRTSGEERLSGFLLWQSAYSELYFLESYWPEFRRIDLLRAIRTYQRRGRRYGK